MDDRAKSLPILVSNDNFVLDGHHRWLANHFTGNGRQNVIRLPWDAKMSLTKMHDDNNIDVVKVPRSCIFTRQQAARLKRSERRPNASRALQLCEDRSVHFRAAGSGG